MAQNKNGNQNRLWGHKGANITSKGSNSFVIYFNVPWREKWQKSKINDGLTK